MGQLLYKCRGCGEVFPGAVCNKEDEIFNDVFIFKTKPKQTQFSEIAFHTCESGANCVADFVGTKK